MLAAQQWRADRERGPINVDDLWHILLVIFVCTIRLHILSIFHIMRMRIFTT